MEATLKGMNEYGIRNEFWIKELTSEIRDLVTQI